THPASTTHGRLSQEERDAAGVHDNIIRLSVGLEHVDDLKADLETGLAAI
ncbi:MAG: O-succinylhomoserine sulfhydrylase, partial [Gammaproteobacteria bacterium]